MCVRIAARVACSVATGFAVPSLLYDMLVKRCIFVTTRRYRFSGRSLVASEVRVRLPNSAMHLKTYMYKQHERFL